MPISEEVKSMLDSLELTPEQRTAAESMFGTEKNAQEIKRGYAARSEASRLMDEAKKEKEAAAAETVKAKESFDSGESYKNTLSQWHEAEKAKFETAQAETKRYRDWLISQEIDPDSIQGKQMTAANQRRAEAVAPAFDEAAFQQKLTNESIRPVAQAFLDLNFDMPVVMAEYQRLYGDLTKADWNAFKAQATANIAKGVPVTQTATELFKFDERRAEISQAAMEKKAQEEAEARFQKLVSEHQLQGGQPLPTGEEQHTDFVTQEDFSKDTRRVSDDELKRPASQETFQRVNQISNELAQKGITPYN